MGCRPYTFSKYNIVDEQNDFDRTRASLRVVKSDKMEVWMQQPLKECLGFIQALRGIAALGIVLWHASRYVAPYGTGASLEFFYPASPGGVGLFFIISGFIMGHTTRRCDGSFRYVYNFFVK